MYGSHRSRYVSAYGLALEVVKAWADPVQKHPKTIHHHGHGTFVVDGQTIHLKSKMHSACDQAARARFLPIRACAAFRVVRRSVR
jgi:hypothetical protein